MKNKEQWVKIGKKVWSKNTGKVKNSIKIKLQKLKSKKSTCSK